MPLGPFVDETDAATRRLVDINLHGVILGSKLALERFLPRRRGHLVQIASAAGKVGVAGGATYCATKHAVVGLSEALYQELRGTGVAISVVMPTVVNTELGSGLPRTAGVRGSSNPSRWPRPSSRRCRPGVSRSTCRSRSRPRSAFATSCRAGSRTASTRSSRATQVLAKPDHVARAAYEARMARDDGRPPHAGSAAGLCRARRRSRAPAAPAREPSLRQWLSAARRRSLRRSAAPASSWRKWPAPAMT